MQYTLTGLDSYPSYYKYMADINRRGPDISGGVPGWLSLVPLSVRSHLDNEAILVDSRPKRSFNDEHLPGCLMATPWLPGSAGW